MRQRWKGADRIFQFRKQRVAGKKWQWAIADRYPPILANRNRSVTRCRGAITAGGAGQVSGRARSGFLPHFIWGFLLSELWSRRGECHTDPGETVVARHMSGPRCRVTGRRGTEWASYPPPSPSPTFNTVCKTPQLPEISAHPPPFSSRTWWTVGGVVGKTVLFSILLIVLWEVKLVGNLSGLFEPHYNDDWVCCMR